jgi:hypothetical protein
MPVRVARGRNSRSATGHSPCYDREREPADPRRRLRATEYVAPVSIDAAGLRDLLGRIEATSGRL